MNGSIRRLALAVFAFVLVSSLGLLDPVATYADASCLDECWDWYEACQDRYCDWRSPSYDPFDCEFGCDAGFNSCESSCS